jgi:hypothetical protein
MQWAELLVGYILIVLQRITLLCIPYAFIKVGCAYLTFDAYLLAE